MRNKIVVVVVGAVALPLVIYAFVADNKTFLDYGTLVMVLGGFYLILTNGKEESK